LRHRDPIGLRLGKVRAWVALDEIRDAFHELEDLARRPGLGKHEGQVLLWRADLGHGRDIDTEAKERLIRQALAKGLGEADEAYARGLLAATPTEAICQFRCTLELDPFHNRATDQLAWQLFMLGQRQEARDLVAKAELIFPEDPSPRVIHALILASEGELGRAFEQLDQVKGHASETTIGHWRSMVKFTDRYHDLDALLLDRPESARGGDILRFIPIFLEAYRTFPSSSESIDSDRMSVIDFPPHMARRLSPLVPKILLAEIGLRGPLLRELKTVFREFSLAELAFVRGGLLFEEGRYKDAEEATLQAIESPSLVNIRRMARLGALKAEYELLKRPAPSPELRDRVRRNIQAFVAMGEADPSRVKVLVDLALHIGDVDLARSALTGWEHRVPGDPEALAVRASVEFEGESYPRAITAARQALRAKPRHSGAQFWLGRSVTRLREQASALAPAEEDSPPP
jgi:tetratricopeptide (TPR) repeat protein